MPEAVVEVGQYLVLPFRLDLARERVNTIILEGCINLPLFPLPMSADDRRLATAAWLTDPDHLIWEVWRGGDLCGILSLSRIVRGLDALAHLAFFDRQLVGRHSLVLAMMDWAFRELDLRRLSVEIPEHFPALIRFCRSKLGFRYEGESGISTSQLVHAMANAGVEETYAAKLGSRKEGMHWFNGSWVDLALLRVTREEFASGRLQHHRST